MGNQQVKGGKRHPATTYPFIEPENKSRTDWTAGVPLSPGKPVVQLSSRQQGPKDEDSVTDEINLTWAVPTDDGGFPITGYKIEMLDIGTNHWIEITFIEGFEPRCTLSNILYGIMYRFRAVAYNDAGPSEPGDASDPVVIDVPGVQIAPYFVLMLNDTIALEHERVEFKVKVLGTPKPTIQWYKDDMEVFCSERLDIKEEDDGGSVIVKEVRLSDSGNIKCVATNILGRATSVGQLMIEAAPRLEIPEKYNEGLIFRFDEVIRLKIPFIAKPPPRITWFFDDEPVCDSEDVSIETAENVTSLRIGAAKRWHCGEFRVLAQNENGEDSGCILVTVTAPPSPPGKPVVIDIAGTTCVLRWEGVQDDGGADVKHYIVEYFRDVWDVWLKAKTTKECQVSIEDLIPGSRYKFRIKAENAYGISEESEESDPFDVGGVNNQETRTGTSLEEGWTSPSEAWSPERGESGQEGWKQPVPSLAVTKESWASTESSEDMLRDGSEMLKDLLRVKKLSQRISSIESDGLPSMSSVDIGDESSLSESSDLQKARKLYAELQAMSMESTGSAEDMPDLDTAAKDFYNEIRALSMETGGSIENILDNIGASSESLASLIPYEKREQLASFEMNLKQMIEEARQLASSPGRSMESLNRMEKVSDTTDRSRKSFSLGSQPESVVSVIEAPQLNFSEEVERRTRRVSERDFPEEAEPIAMSMRGRPVERVVRRPKEPLPLAPSPQPPPQLQQQQPGTKLQPQESVDEAPPLEELPPPLPLIQPEPSPRQQSAGPRMSPQQASVGGGFQAGRRHGQVVNREPSVGSDRYEDIIIETRKRSLSRPGSKMGSRMGSRTSSQVDFRTSQSDFTNASTGRLDLDSIRASTKNITTALDLDTKMIEAARQKTETPEANRRKISSADSSIAPGPPPPTIQPQTKRSPSLIKQKDIAFDGNQNATAATLPAAVPGPRRHTTPKSNAAASTPDPIVELFPKNIPHWFVITYTYSVVLIMILLIANSTPDGKLYVHFTALWSLVIYFMLEDEQESDILDKVVEEYLIK